MGMGIRGRGLKEVLHRVGLVTNWLNFVTYVVSKGQDSSSFRVGSQGKKHFHSLNPLMIVFQFTH